MARAQGYHTPLSYILTQLPLAKTVDDFWRLVVEQQCRTIVLLDAVDSDDVSHSLHFISFLRRVLQLLDRVVIRLAKRVQTIFQISLYCGRSHARAQTPKRKREQAVASEKRGEQERARFFL